MESLGITSQNTDRIPISNTNNLIETNLFHTVTGNNQDDKKKNFSFIKSQSHLGHQKVTSELKNESSNIFESLNLISDNNSNQNNQSPNNKKFSFIKKEKSNSNNNPLNSTGTSNNFNSGLDSIFSNAGVSNLNNNYSSNSNYIPTVDLTKSNYKFFYL